jgi:hypothetical protein
MQPMSALLIAAVPGLADYGLSALPDAPVVPERHRRFHRVTVASPLRRWPWRPRVPAAPRAA